MFTGVAKRAERNGKNLEGQPSDLVLSHAYPHKPVQSEAIARSGKTSLSMAVFSVYSTRSSSTSVTNIYNFLWKTLERLADGQAIILLEGFTNYLNAKMLASHWWINLISQTAEKMEA